MKNFKTLDQLVSWVLNIESFMFKFRDLDGDTVESLWDWLILAQPEWMIRYATPMLTDTEIDHLVKRVPWVAHDYALDFLTPEQQQYCKHQVSLRF